MLGLGYLYAAKRVSSFERRLWVLPHGVTPSKLQRRAILLGL